MFNKTLITEFFTTINFSTYIRTLTLLTFKLPFLRYWRHSEFIESQLLSYVWNLNSEIISFYNWRSAIYYALKIIWVTNKDEVIVQWYTCVSVPNAVIQSWAKIIYSDIEKNTLWFDVDDLEKNITNNTKVIIIQHTFWKPSKIKKIINLAKSKNIIVIEDCAHSLWSRVNWQKLWTFWDFAVFSTGRDKVISWITWWFLIINNDKYFNKVELIKKELIMPSIKLTIRNLLYNIFAFNAYIFYNFFWLWKVIIYLWRKFNLITEIITMSEKQCNYDKFNYKLPNSLAFLASKELQKIKMYTTHRISISEYYDELLNNNELIKPVFTNRENERNNSYRYPIIIKSEELKDELYEYMKKNNVLLWKTWSGTNIVPIWVNFINVNYKIWTCLNAEYVSKRILTLPNHSLIYFKDAKKIVQLLNNFKNNV